MSRTEFCKECKGSTSTRGYQGILQLECNSCHTKVDLPPHATLRYVESADNDLMVCDKMLQQAAKDPMNKKDDSMPCPKCNNKYSRTIHINDAKVLFTCINCKFIWTR